VHVGTANALAYVVAAGIASLFVAPLALEWYMLVRTRAHWPAPTAPRAA
jgi:hypothetical protein